MLALTAAAGVYVRNGHCFICEADQYTTTCEHHTGPCDTRHASVQEDECRNYHCDDCNTCTLNGTYTCYYSARYLCTDDAHIGQTMYDRTCKSTCEATHPVGGGGGECPFTMLCE
jgi:hypothetical protein